jgi:probable rRNA maturation factor
VLEETGFSACDLSVSLVEDREIIALNDRYFGRKGPTDVISFPMEEEARDGALLGDVVVCVPQAVRAAAERRLPVEEELSLYLIHGILHLLGQQDNDPAEREQMKKKQEAILELARDNEKLIVTVDSR